MGFVFLGISDHADPIGEKIRKVWTPADVGMDGPISKSTEICAAWTAWI